MAAELLSFLRRAPANSGDWSTQEIAEFYRVEAALIQAGLSLVVDRGMTDEGDPWFVFCRAGDGEVIVHFARIAGTYLIAADSVRHPLSGQDFRTLLAQFVSMHPSLIPVHSSKGSKLLLHPASLLAAVVATALFQMTGSEAVANTINPKALGDDSDAPGTGDHRHELQHKTGLHTGWSDRQIAAAVAAMIALAVHEYHAVEPGPYTVLASLSDAGSDHIVLSRSVVASAPAVTDTDVRETAMAKVEVVGHSEWDGHGLQSGGSIITQFWSNAAGQLQVDMMARPEQAASGDVSRDAAANDRWQPHVAWTAAGSLDGPSHDGSDAFAWALRQQALTAPIGASGAGKVADSYPRGSGGPADHAGSSTTDIRTVVSLVNDEAASSSRAPIQVSLASSNSVSEPIRFGAVDLLSGSASPTILAFIEHDIHLANDEPAAGSLMGTSHVEDVAPAASATASPLTPLAVTPLTVTPSTITVSTTPTTALLTAPAVSVAPAVEVVSSRYHSFDATASSMLNTFLQTNDWRGISTDHALIFYDQNASHFSSPDLVVRTWSLGGEDTVSIVGLLPHNLAILA